jgi:hypothetical protein
MVHKTAQMIIPMGIGIGPVLEITKANINPCVNHIGPELILLADV